MTTILKNKRCLTVEATYEPGHWEYNPASESSDWRWGHLELKITTMNGTTQSVILVNDRPEKPKKP